MAATELSELSEPKVVVFAGPTVSPDDVRRVLPLAEVRPPAGRGDLLAGPWTPGDTAVIIDGYFRERRSVGHKEILWLIAEGVDVVGAASMGALRAAELAPCGMRGLGTVYEMYASGEIDGDDEVGVLHGPAALGYPAQTLALVNLRHGCREGAESELVPSECGARIVAAAKALPFTARSVADLEKVLDPEDHDALWTLDEMIVSGHWDLKRLDALAALRAVADDGDSAVPRHPAGAALTGIGHTQLLTRGSRREYAPGRWMSHLDVLNAARLFDPAYPELHERVLTDLLAELAAAEDADVAAYARSRLGVDGSTPLPPALASWLGEAECADLQAADRLPLVMTRVWPVWQSADWRPAVIAALRASADWDTWTDLVAQADEVAEQTRYQLVVPPPPISGRLFLRHWQRPGSAAEVELARRGFTSVEDLGDVVRRFFAYDVRRGRAAQGSR